MAISLNDLANLYCAQGKYTHDHGKYAEAEPLYMRALAIREKTLGPDHPDVATCLKNLATLRYFQGKYAEAELLYKRALAIFEKFLGPDHPDVATSLSDLALLYYKQGKYAEAEPLYKRGLTIFEKSLGPDHPDVAISLDDLALLYYEQGKYAEAESLLKRAARIVDSILGPNHPDTKIIKSNLLVCQIALFGWGLVLIAVGIINLLWEYTIHGAVLIVTGLFALLIRRHGMFTLSGIVLSLIGILNIFGGEFGGRTVFSVLQLFVGLYMIRKFWKYALRK